MQPHPDGSFTINVYDPDDPYKPLENSDGVEHDARLVADQIYVDPNGSWSFTGGIGTTWSGPAIDMRLMSFKSLSGRLNPFADEHGYLTTLGPITQLEDRSGHSLYDAQGNLTSGAQRPLGVYLANSITGIAPSAGAASTGLLLQAGGRYLETIGAGTIDFAGEHRNGEVTTVGGKLTIASAGKVIEVIPNHAGAGKLELTDHNKRGQTTIAVSGQLAGELRLQAGTTTTVTAGQSATLTVSISRAGLGQPPQTFSFTRIHLLAGQHLSLGSLRTLNLAAPRMHATLSRSGHRKTITLTNRTRRASIAIVSASAKHTKSRVHVILRLRTSAGRGSHVIVMLKGAGSATTIRRVARRRLAISVLLPRQRHAHTLRVWTVALTRAGQASQVMKATVSVH